MNKFVEKIKNGKIAVGTHAQLGCQTIAEMFGIAGFDAVWLDTEHAAVDKRDLLHNVIALHGYRSAAVVRIPWNDPVLAKPVLEMGVDGIVFPYVRSAEDVQQAMESCLYPPDGCRGFGPIRANKYGMMSNNEYLSSYIDSTFRIAQIEHVDAVRSIDKILKVKHLNGVVFGPNDLSGSLGVLGQADHPEVQKCFDIVAEASKRAGIPFGVSTGYNTGTGGGSLRQWVDRGVNFVFVGSDVSYVMSGAVQMYEEVDSYFNATK